MYCLQAVIATEHLLIEMVDAIQNGRVVPLGGHLSMLPVTDALADAVAVAGAPQPGGFRKLPAGFDRTLAACSANGPVAYVEAEYFGGDGEQSAQVWDSGTVVLGPLRSAEGEPFAADGSPISQALRWLGVAKGNHHDEFDAVGLGRHRNTEDWLRSIS